MRRKRVGQGALAAASWLLFIYYWWLVSRRRLNPETVISLSILAVLVGAVCLSTLLWIRHNKRIAQRAGDRRKHRLPLPPSRRTDALGRELLDQGELPVTDAPYVEIEIDDDSGHKRYLAMSAPPLAGDSRQVDALSGNGPSPEAGRP